jgi:hypothetical protein
VPTFTAVVCCHDESRERAERGLYGILGNLRYQTRPPDETLVYLSGVTPDLARVGESFPEVRLQVVEDRQDWGHHKRATGLAEAAGEYVGFFNHDDSYASGYIEKMLAETPADAVFCNWSGGESCSFVLGSSTSGNFIVRTDFGRACGYPFDAGYCADGEFINRLAVGNVKKVHEILYFHNTLE